MPPASKLEAAHANYGNPNAHFKLQVRSREVSYHMKGGTTTSFTGRCARVNVVHAMYIWGDFQDEDLI